jgi:hypothetical protein
MNHTRLELEYIYILEKHEKRLKLLMWQTADVDRLHVKRNRLAGMNFLVI